VRCRGIKNQFGNFCMLKVNRSVNLYLKLVNYFMLCGKKIKMKEILDKVFGRLVALFLVPLEEILLCLFDKLRVFVEIKKMKRGRRTHLVPMPTKSRRKLHLVLIYIFESVLQSKSKIGFEDRLYIEIKKIVLDEPSVALDLRNKNNKFVRESRANLHYRW